MVQALKGSSLEERVAYLNDRLKSARKRDLDAYQEQFDISWIYHDSALEGVVYTMDELKSAFYDEVVSDKSLIPVYDEIRNHKGAIEIIRQQVEKRRFSLTLDVIKQLFAQLAPEELEGKSPPKYRKDVPHHRLYFHEINSPAKISYNMRQLVQWANDPSVKKSIHPIRLASRVHYEMLHIYPFPRHSGKVARLVMNMLLLRQGYPPAVIHASERQRYYEALKASEDVTATLVSEALTGSVESAIRFFEEAA